MQIALTTGTTDLTRVLRYIDWIHVRESAGTPAAYKLQFANGNGGTPTLVLAGAASGTVTDTPPLIFPKPLFFPAGVYITSLTGTWNLLIRGH